MVSKQYVENLNYCPLFITYSLLFVYIALMGDQCTSKLVSKLLFE